MGYYTELIFGVELKKDVPESVVKILQWLCDEHELSSPEPLPNHPLFNCDRWQRLFTCSSYYFGVNEPVSKIWYDDISESWRISTRSNLKNYDDEIEHFLDWIKPYLDSGSGSHNFYAIVTTEDGLPKIYYLDEG